MAAENTGNKAIKMGFFNNIGNWFSDYYHLTATMINPSHQAPVLGPMFTEKERAELATLSPEERKKRTFERIAESQKDMDRYVGNAYQIEKDLTTTAQGLAVAGGTLASGGNVGVGLLAAGLVEGGADVALATKGEAPTNSLYKRMVPATDVPVLNLLGGDAHYQAGGTSDTHPEHLHYVEAVRQAKEKVAKISPATAVADEPSVIAASNTTESPVTTPPADTTGEKKPGLFGIGSLIGAALLGITGFFTAGGTTGAVILAVIGALSGQTLLNAGADLLNKSGLTSKPSAAPNTPDAATDTLNQTLVADVDPHHGLSENVTGKNNPSQGRG